MATETELKCLLKRRDKKNVDVQKTEARRDIVIHEHRNEVLVGEGTDWDTDSKHIAFRQFSDLSYLEERKQRD